MTIRETYVCIKNIYKTLPEEGRRAGVYGNTGELHRDPATKVANRDNKRNPRSIVRSFDPPHPHQLNSSVIHTQSWYRPILCIQPLGAIRRDANLPVQVVNFIPEKKTESECENHFPPPITYSKSVFLSLRFGV